MKIKNTCLLMLSLASLSYAQSSFTYSFDAADGTPWPSDWSGPSFQIEGHHDGGWGFDDPASGTDDYTGVFIGDNSANVTGAKYYNQQTYDITQSSINYTMGWNANGGKGFIDDVASGKAGVNQIFQIGLLNLDPRSRANVQFGTDIGSTTVGQDSFYLGGVELTASTATQMGSLDLKYFDESGLELANFGTMNYSASTGTDTHHFNFRQDIVDLNNGSFTVTLTVDEYTLNAFTNTTTYLGQTSYGTQTVTHNLSDVSSLNTGLGIRIQDFANVSITAANYDGGVAVIVPEPSSVMLSLIGSFALVLRRRR